MITAHDPKRFATLQAQAALAGIALNQIDGDFGSAVFVINHEAVTRQFDDLDQVEVSLDFVSEGVMRSQPKKEATETLQRHSTAKSTSGKWSQ